MACSLVSVLLALLLVASPCLSDGVPPTAVGDVEIPCYTIVDAGSLRNGDQIVVAGLSSAGQIAGYCYSHVSPGHGDFASGHAFYWSAGRIVELLGLERSFSHALAINGAGDIVGDADVQGRTLPALWTYAGKGSRRSKPVSLSPENGSAVAVAENGHVLVEAIRPFLYSEGKITSLELPADRHLCGINSLDEIVGYTAMDTWPPFTEGEEKGFAWRMGQMRRLPTLGGKRSICRNLNDRGTIIGWAETQTGERHACYWENDRIYDLGTLGGKESEANGVNAQDIIVGESSLDEKQGDFACLWYKGKIVNLNACLPAKSGWILRSAKGINAQGEIAGTGVHKGQAHAFLLRPVSTALVQEQSR